MMARIVNREGIDRALALVAQGRRPVDAAAEAGIPKSTLYRHLRGSSPPVPGPSPAPDPLAGPAVPESVGGLDAARAAIGAGPVPDKGAGPSPGPSPSPPRTGTAPTAGQIAVDTSDPDSLVAFMQVLTVMTCKATCAVRRWKVPPKEMARLSILSPQEAAQLRMFAPYAAPWVARALAHMDKIGAACFFVSYAFMLGERFSTFKQYAPPKEARPEPEPEPAPAPTPTGPPTVDSGVA